MNVAFVSRLVVIAAAHLAAAQAVTPPDASRCLALKSADFVSLMDAPTQVTQAKLIAATQDFPEHCQVSGYVAPSVGFLLRLPSQWNNKLLQQGCGGFCGNANAVGGEQSLYLGPLRRGYAYVTFNGGHQIRIQGDERLDSALWAYHNLEAQFDFGVRAPHVVALASKAIVERYYSQAPRRAYFTGCSSGGQQGLSEAQRFPWDFDGIIVGAPSPTFSGPMMNYLWAGRALAGRVDRSKLVLLHQAVLNRCDKSDGLVDGVVGDPLHCQLDPAELLCKRGQTKDCLTTQEVEAVRQVYDGPTTSKGERLYSGGPARGSELNWIGDASCCAYVDASGSPARWAQEYFAYIGFSPPPGPGWKADDFNFDRDYKRLRVTESVFGAADNPDLRKFKAAGGRMLMYQGWQDQSDIPADAIDYYETAQKTMGGKVATQEFFRLFMIPGMDHCSGGAGAFAIDYLQHLEDWVENGKAPDMLIGAHVDGLSWIESLVLPFPLDPALPVRFTRPVFPYPALARYDGVGDPSAATSFVRAETH